MIIVIVYMYLIIFYVSQLMRNAEISNELFCLFSSCLLFFHCLWHFYSTTDVVIKQAWGKRGP